MQQGTYVHYYWGQKTKAGHDFHEFEVNSSGRLRYSCKPCHTNKDITYKTMKLSADEVKQLSAIIDDSEILKHDDADWPIKGGSIQQELDIHHGSEEISLSVPQMRSREDVLASKDPEGLGTFCVLTQNLIRFFCSIIETEEFTTNFSQETRSSHGKRQKSPLEVQPATRKRQRKHSAPSDTDGIHRWENMIKEGLKVADDKDLKEGFEMCHVGYNGFLKIAQQLPERHPEHHNLHEKAAGYLEQLEEMRAELDDREKQRTQRSPSIDSSRSASCDARKKEESEDRIVSDRQDVQPQVVRNEIYELLRGQQKQNMALSTANKRLDLVEQKTSDAVLIVKHYRRGRVERATLSKELTSMVTGLRNHSGGDLAKFMEGVTRSTSAVRVRMKFPDSGMALKTALLAKIQELNLLGKLTATFEGKSMKRLLEDFLRDAAYILQKEQIKGVGNAIKAVFPRGSGPSFHYSLEHGHISLINFETITNDMTTTMKINKDYGVDEEIALELESLCSCPFALELRNGVDA